MASVVEEVERPLNTVAKHSEIDQFNPCQLVSLIFYIERLPLYEEEKPFFLNFPPSGPGQRQSNVVYCRREVSITDVRNHEGLFTLDTTGFQYKHFATTVDYKDFASPAAIEGTFLKEVEAFLTTELNADYVLAWDYQVRRRDPTLPPNHRGQPGKAQPFRSVHCDESARAAMRRLGHFHPYLAENFWKPLVGPVEDAPLALCDYRTVAPADRVPTDIVFPDYLGETYNFWANPEHRWYYLEGQLATEALIFKCFDSEAISNDKIAQCWFETDLSLKCSS
ncbi:conserved hypothetical protein [Histoplasma capsulatum var. duboisii H88]|uniref:Uncharacterized protein n=2 Tax=Ajellomyces capsulatus TaxID=5037 RepID=F0UP77_AJEC8|nr:conserved hypothetical protein [Histoplasma capsulatum H143]EGC47729.1 conserved hypothetical protein [Histoplasma capsulatum var. duboisii H88]